MLFWQLLPEDDAYQTFLEDEFAFNIRLIARGQKQFILHESSIFCRELQTFDAGIQNSYNCTQYGFKKPSHISEKLLSDRGKK